MAAKSHQLEIIPLVQTFGHLEWLLKLDKFELYRDDLALPMVITPCLNSTYVLLEGNISINLCFVHKNKHFCFYFRSFKTNT